MKPLRVLIVSEPGIDGVFRHVEGLIDFLLISGVYVDFVYSSVRTTPTLYKLIKRVRNAGGQTLDIATGNGPSLADICALLRLSEFVRQRKPSIIHAHSSKAGALVRLLPLKKHIGLYYTPNAYYGMGVTLGLKNLIFNGIERRLGNRAISIHVSPEESEFAANTLKLNKAQSVTIPNAVDFNIFHPSESREQKARIKEQLGIPNDKIVIGSIGRLSCQKNPELLYRAFALFAEQRDQTEPLYLLHVGNGSATEMREMHQLAVELGIVDQVVRPAYRSDPEVFYRAMDAFCLSSRYEGLPFTGLEALASNLPLILTDAPGLQSFGDASYGFSHVYYGQLADDQSLADAMQAWYTRRNATVNHRTIAQQHFSIPEVYGKILQLYQQYVR